MPRLSRWFIRSSLVHLALGITIGALLLFHKGIPLHPDLWRLLPLHIEFLLFGWTMQLILGVGFWIFPRFRRSRGNEKPGWLAFGLLNVGIWLVGLGPLLDGATFIITLGRLAEVGAVLAFAIHVWPRIKPSAAA